MQPTRLHSSYDTFMPGWASLRGYSLYVICFTIVLLANLLPDDRRQEHKELQLTARTESTKANNWEDHQAMTSAVSCASSTTWRRSSAGCTPPWRDHA